MFVEVKKIYRGKVDVRDYAIKDCLAKKQDLIITHGKENMTIPYKEIRKRGERINKERFKSKIYPDQYYTLISFPWKPSKPLTEEEYFKQNNLF